MIPETNNVKEQYNLLDDLAAGTYTEASSGQRFLNLLIDGLLLRFGLSYVYGMGVGYLFYAISPELYFDMFSDLEGFKLYMVGYLLNVPLWVFYYTFCEKVFKGYTLGKLLTGTKAIREDGQELSFKDALLRSLIRIIPFEAFSGFGTPWHDSWSKTTVVRTR
ncbi:MAG TPA: RDD family protein [Flavisolibacter sp.]|nr:RDD family protein [Flavisolibacter sp.]